MTEKQATAIARAIKRNRDDLGEDEYKLIDGLAIDIANAIDTYSTKFERTKFLRECGHKDYQLGTPGHK